MTLPTEAADDPEMVSQMTAGGMDVARVNCAHDDTSTWSRMIERVATCRRSNGHAPRVAMDLAGPKVRTGPLEPGPRVLRLSPRRDRLGVVGFCMGGMLTLILATQRPDKIAAAVPFYGFPQGDMEPDWGPLDAVVRGHMAEHDDFFGPDAARALEAKLQGMGKDVQFTVHPGTGHAFMGPHNALGTLDEAVAAELWPGVIAFLHEQLG